MDSLKICVLLSLALFAAGCRSADATTVIETDGMRFKQTEVHLKAGQPASLRVINRDGYAHGFDIDAFDVHKPLDAREIYEMSFTPASPGRYRFYCGSPGHEAAGMEGVLVVDP